MVKGPRPAQAVPGWISRAFVEGLTATDFGAAGSAAGKVWLAALPSLIVDLADQWGLTVGDGQARHGYNAIVVPVDRGGRPLALKLSWPPGQVQDEADALTAWQGRGAVELVDVDIPHDALLLERLDAARSLAGLPVAEAAAIAGALIRTLAIPAPLSFPAVQAEARELARTIPARQLSLHDVVPGPWVTLAAGLAADLAFDTARELVHTDLHYDNILTSHRPGQPWAAIDPKAAAGAPERAVAELLWTRADELPDPAAITGLLDTIIDAGRLDPAKATAWAFVRTVDYWLWAVHSGLTIDPPRCHRIAAALASPASQAGL
jgi:streptomycin 6-kinase